MGRGQWLVPSGRGVRRGVHTAGAHPTVPGTVAGHAMRAPVSDVPGEGTAGHPADSLA